MARPDALQAVRSAAFFTGREHFETQGARCRHGFDEADGCRVSKLIGLAASRADEGVGFLDVREIILA